jgi:hypothetical protein
MRKRIFGNLALALVLTIWVVLTPAPAAADPIFIFDSPEFDISGINPVAGGSITQYASGFVDTLSFDPQSGASTIPIYHTQVNLEGGPIDFYNTPEVYANALLLAFDTGAKTISLTGTILDLGGEGGLDTNLLILSGQFTNVNAIVDQSANLLSITGDGLDTKDPSLLALFGYQGYSGPNAWHFDFTMNAKWDVDHTRSTIHPSLSRRRCCSLASDLPAAGSSAAGKRKPES